MENVRHLTPRDTAGEGGFERVPPQDLDAEQAVLGAMFYARQAIDDATAAMDPSDHYRPAHETIHRTILALHAAGEPVDPITVAAALTKSGEISRIGGPSYLHTLASIGISYPAAGQYADIVHERAVSRRVVEAGMRIVQLGYASGDLGSVREEALKHIEDATEDVTPQQADATGWGFSDLTPVLDGTHKPAQPVIGARDDGIGMFYPGRINGIQGESEAGKSWVALISCLVEMNRGNTVCYMDFEDSEEGVVGRLLLIGATPDQVAELFLYVRPGVTPTPAQLRAFIAGVADRKPTLIVVDGVTEAMTMLGGELKENSDIARFGRTLLRPLADTGAAVVPLDHVVKNNESRGRYSLGGVHKLNAVDGVQYMLEAVRPFGINTEGRSRLRIAKDRPAQIRRHALPGGRNPMHWFADLVIRSEGDTFAEAHLYAPIERNDEPDAAAQQSKAAQEEQDIAEREQLVLQALTKAAEPMSKNALEELIPGRASVTRRALTRLVHGGRVVAEKGARGAALHRLPAPGGEAS